jgi:hypothetical protein
MQGLEETWIQPSNSQEEMLSIRKASRQEGSTKVHSWVAKPRTSTINPAE